MLIGAEGAGNSSFQLLILLVMLGVVKNPGWNDIQLLKRNFILRQQGTLFHLYDLQNMSAYRLMCEGNTSPNDIVGHFSPSEVLLLHESGYQSATVPMYGGIVNRIGTYSDHIVYDEAMQEQLKHGVLLQMPVMTAKSF